MGKGPDMTDYERLASDLTAGGIKASVATARRLADRAMYGEAMTDTEARIVAAWEARTAREPWHPDAARQKGNG